MVRRASPPVDEATLREALQKKYNRSLYDFVHDVMGYKAVYPPLHRDVVCSWLQDWTKPIKVLALPREHLKSTIGLSFVNWLWSITEPELHNIPTGPETRVMLAHGRQKSAKQYLREMKDHHEKNETYRWMYPEIMWDNPSKHADLWQADQINVKRKEPSKTPSLFTTSEGGTAVGYHFDVLILDDLVHDRNYRNPEMRENTYQYFQTCQAYVRGGGIQLILCTRWHWDDYVGKLLEENGKHCDQIDSLVLGSGYFDGKPIYPVSAEVPRCGFDMDRLEQRRGSMSDYHFFAQYENVPKRGGSESFAEEDIQRYRLDLDEGLPVKNRNFAIFTAIDPNRSLESSNDPCVVLTAAIDSSGDIWVLDIYRGHPTAEQTVDMVFQHVERHDPDAVIIETTGYQLHLKNWIERRQLVRETYFRVVEAKRGPTSRKYDRIMALLPVVERKALHVPFSANGDQLVKELVQFPASKNDDCADALADVFRYGKVPEKPVLEEARAPSNPYLLKNILAARMKPRGTLNRRSVRYGP